MGRFYIFHRNKQFRKTEHSKYVLFLKINLIGTRFWSDVRANTLAALGDRIVDNRQIQYQLNLILRLNMAHQ